jgi:predicted PurR-regulated permease PerM
MTIVVIAMPTWIAGIRKGPSGNIHVNLDSSTPCWNDAIEECHQRKSRMNNENRFEQIAGMAILLLLVIGCYVVLRPFVSALLLALILSYSTFPVYAWCERVLQGRKGLAATLMTLLVAVVLLIPLIILGSNLAEQIAAAIRWARRAISEGPPDPPSWIATIP